jgi:hypothetical protein
VDFNELNNIGVLEELHEVDLVHKPSLPEFLGLDVCFVESLDRALGFCAVVLGEVDLPEGALAEHLDGVEFGVEIGLNGDF